MADLTWNEAIEIGRRVPIPLPSEPPRDRIIEAVDADGKVNTWEFVESWGSWRRAGGDIWAWSWTDIVHDAIQRDWSLRHVPAEEGETS